MTSLPTGAITPRMTRVLLAVLVVRQRLGRAPLRAVAEAAGYSSVGSMHHVVRKLRDAGLVTWEEGRVATLRPTVGPVGRRAA